MHWKLKAVLQNSLGCLPSRLSYEAHYRLQRAFGGLRTIDPVPKLRAGLRICEMLATHGRAPTGGTFLEVGTGRRINAPIVFWLLGADSVVTVDLHPYVRPELVREDLAYIARHAAEIRDVLASPHFDERRYRALLDFANSNDDWNLSDLLELCRIRYIAPGDATRLDLEPSSVDFHVSYTVLEHIPPPVLEKILHEASRVLRPQGLLAHWVDHSDHFSHDDSSISSINFLQYTDCEWHAIAGNRYTYMNRLRVDDMRALYERCRQHIVAIDPVVDEEALSVLRKDGLKLADRFRAKSAEALCTSSAWFVSRPDAANWQGG